MTVNLSTVQKWSKEGDRLGLWFRHEVAGGKVSRIFCALCKKHSDRLKPPRNYNPAFVDDIADNITGTALKKDNVVKHKNTDMHSKAVNMERQPTQTISSILKSTPLGKAFGAATTEETDRVTKLFDIAYLLVKEEMPFTKFSAIVKMEKLHGVPLGNTYCTLRRTNVKNSQMSLENV